MNRRINRMADKFMAEMAESSREFYAKISTPDRVTRFAKTFKPFVLCGEAIGLAVTLVTLVQKAKGNEAENELLALEIKSLAENIISLEKSLAEDIGLLKTENQQHHFEILAALQRKSWLQRIVAHLTGNSSTNQ